MELGEGLKIMENFLDGGVHNYTEYKQLLSFMFAFLNYSHRDNIELDFEVIEFAYKTALEHMNGMKLRKE